MIDQPPPHPGRMSIDYQRLYIEIGETLEHQWQKGIDKYGQGLQTWDGRDTYVDALQEIADTAAYLKKLNLEKWDAIIDSEVLAILLNHFIKLTDNTYWGKDPRMTSLVKQSKEYMESRYAYQGAASDQRDGRAVDARPAVGDQQGDAGAGDRSGESDVEEEAAARRVWDLVKVLLPESDEVHRPSGELGDSPTVYPQDGVGRD